MTTVVDPTGTPTIIFNQTGVAVVTVTVASGSPITVGPYAGTTVFLANNTSGNTGNITLNSDFQIGDVVEIYAVGPNSVNVYDENSNNPFVLSGDHNNGVRMRKIYTTGFIWGWVRGAI